MADYTFSSNSVPRPYGTYPGGPQLRWYEESTFASGQGIRRGDVVQFDVNTASNSFRIIRSSTMANAPNVLSTAFIGLAAADSTSDGSTGQGFGATPAKEYRKIPVFVANPQTTFLFPTKGSVVPGSTTIGALTAIGYDSTTKTFYADLNNSTAGDARMRVVDVPSPGDTNGYVACVFNSTAVKLGTWR